LGDDFDPHKPYIDRYTWPAKSGKGTMRRAPEVIDAWFDSGSMPFAQWHYPFENKEKFKRHYPADFINEGIDQTRGWFYSLLAIATGLGDALPQNTIEGGPAPYRSVVVNDLVLAKDGSKMSKSRGNTVDPWTVIAKHGVDAIRLFLVSSSQVWMPRRFDEEAIRETVGRFLITFKNVYSGIFALYANFGWAPSDEDPLVADRPAIDRWILSRLSTVEHECDQFLDRFDATLAVRAVTEFFVDDVSNWYVRLTRHRFYDVNSADNRAAFATLHEVLMVTCRLLAPFAPFATDWVHRELTGESVHVAPYTRPNPTPIEERLERAMAHVRTLSTLGRAAREEAGVKVRQPLARMVCVVPRDSDADDLHPLVPLLQAELNIKTVTFASSADDLVTLEAKPNFRALGKKFGKQTPLAAAAVAAFTSEALRRFERGEELEVAVENESHPLSLDDMTIVRRASGDLVVKDEGAYFAAIDPTVTPELRREGIARELVSRVQRLRKELDFAVSDRITLHVFGDDDTQEAVGQYRDWIAEEVLALDVQVEVALAHDGSEDRAAHLLDLDGRAVRVALTRIG
jgi:isoleucyl-tRNA synthetase